MDASARGPRCADALPSGRHGPVRVTPGRGRQHLQDGSTVEHGYLAGETRHETYPKGESKVHDLENIGDTELVFATVEFLNSANAPLPVPQAKRPNG